MAYNIIKEKNNIFYIVSFFLILIAGSLVRFNSIYRSLYLDEAWVANSVLTSSITNTIYYDSWLQTSPPLFLILLRWTSHVLKDIPNMPEALRFVPALFGVFSILAMIYLSLRLLKPNFALIATLLFAFSPYLVRETLTLKQYSSDVFSTIALLILTHKYLIKRSKKHLYFTQLGFIILGFLSYPSICFIPALLYATLFHPIQINGESKWRLKINIKISELVLVATCATLVSSINYVAFITPNVNNTLKDYWEPGFLNILNKHDFYVFYSKTLNSFLKPFFFAGYNFNFKMVPSLFSVKMLLIFIIIIGLLGPIWRGKDYKFEKLETAIILTIPIFCVLVLNIFKMYPLRSRLLLFLFPIIVLLFSCGLQFISELFVSFFNWNIAITISSKKFESYIGLTMFTIFTLILVLAVIKNSSPFISKIPPTEEVRGAMEYLSENSKGKDILYIHSSMREQFKLYANLYPISSDTIIQGDVGWPCCPRENSNDRLSMPEQYMPYEISRINYSDDNYYLRLLFTNRLSHWEYIERNDPEIFNLWLSRIGCEKVASVIQYNNVRIDEYICK